MLYWGDVFGKKVIFKLLAEDDFSPYIDKKGNVYKRVQISKSGKRRKRVTGGKRDNRRSTGCSF